MNFEKLHRFQQLLDVVGNTDSIMRSRLALSFLEGRVNKSAEEVANIIRFHEYLYNETDYPQRSRWHVHHRTLQLCHELPFETAFATAKSELKNIKDQYFIEFMEIQNA